MSPAQYALRLRAIRVFAHIGVGAKERAAAQELLVDLDLEFPVSALPKNDRLQRTTDYGRIVDWVVEESRTPCRLLETYAERVLSVLLERTPVHDASVRITKVRVPTKHPVGEAVVHLRATRPAS